MGDFPEPALRCTRAPDIWQIGARLHESPAFYYLVRRAEGFRFTMAAVSETPFEDCKQPDPDADRHPGVFPPAPSASPGDGNLE
jgi:hypothetical protein